MSMGSGEASSLELDVKKTGEVHNENVISIKQCTEQAVIVINTFRVVRDADHVTSYDFSLVV